VTDSLTIAYAGTPELAAVILRTLLQDGRHRILQIYTQPDRRAGRGRKLQPGPVKRLAEDAGIPVFQPRSGQELQVHPALAAVDVLAVAAFGLILPESVIRAPRHGAVNVHTSLLPRWRGAAPIQRAIEAGDELTGITIMQMDAGLDTGDILLQQSCPIHPEDTAGSLQERLAALGGECLLRALDQIAAGEVQPVPQDEAGACYAYKISKAEAEIDWTLPAAVIERRIRAFNPAPVAHTTVAGQSMRIWRARVLEDTRGDRAPGEVVACTPAGLDVATGTGVLRIESLQLPGKKMISAADFHRGYPRFHK